MSIESSNLQVGWEFAGKIPAEIGTLRNLQQLQLENNHIVGSIPRSISNLSSLLLLNFNTNSLSGNFQATCSTDY